MSSGRTAGVICRTTIRSIAHVASRPAAARRSTSSLTTAARASTRRVPLLVRRSTSAVPAARKTSTARAAAPGATPGRTTSQSDASSRKASSRPAGGPLAAWPAAADERSCSPGAPASPAAAGAGHLENVNHINSARQGSIKPVLHFGGCARRCQGNLEVFGLARGARLRSPRVRNLRVRRKPRRISDGQSGDSYSPLDGARNVPMAREAHPASFSVPDDESLGDRRRRRARWRGTSHLCPAFNASIFNGVAGETAATGRDGYRGSGRPRRRGS